MLIYLLSHIYNKILENKIAEEERDIEENTLIQLGSHRIAKYWGVDEDEDEDADDGKKIMPLEARQHAIFAGSLITIFALSGYLGSKNGQSVFASSVAGASMDMVKKYFPHTKETQLLRYTIVALSILTFAGSIALPYVPDEKKSLLLYRVATAVPWSFPAFGILKVTMSNNNISEFVRSKNICNLTLSSTQIKAASAITQIIAIIGLQIGLSRANMNDPSFAAASGIFYKTNARTLTNILGEETSKIEHRTIRVLAGGTVALITLAATSVGYAGNSLDWFNSFQGFLIGYLLIALTDIFVRTIKQTIRIKVDEAQVTNLREKIGKLRVQLDESSQEEPTLLQKALEGTKKVGYGLLNCVVPVSAAFVLGAMNPDPNKIKNAGLIASLTQDATSLCKLPTKLLPVRYVIAASGFAVALGVAGYTVKEMPNITQTAPVANATDPSFDWPCYSATLALACIAASFASYHARRLIRPPKVKDVEQKNELKKAKNEAKEKKNKAPKAILETNPVETTPLQNKT